MNHILNGNLSPFDKYESPTNIITDMSHMLDGCSSLISLPDIGKLNLKNVSDISNMFSNCSSLISLPNLSDWNTEDIIKIISMF